VASLQVPGGLTITEGSGSNRMYREQEVLRKYFPYFVIAQDSAGRLTARGVLSTEINSYGIRVVLPSNYPYEMPAVVPLDWKAGGPHVYPNGQLCVMQLGQWRTPYTIALMVAKAAIWVNKYEVYKRYGSWPGNEQFHDWETFRSLRKWWDNL
jgi:hypothetical protein